MKQKRTIILVVLIVALIVIALGTISNIAIKNRLTQNLLNEYQEQELLIANQVAENLQNSLAATQKQLELVASMPEVRDGAAELCNAKLDEALELLEGKIGNLGRVDSNGYFKCSHNRALVDVKAERFGVYISQIFKDPEHKPVLSRIVRTPGTDSHVAALHVPVYNSDRAFSGTVGGAIYFDDMQKKYLQEVKFAQNGFVALLDDNGDILYHPDRELIGKNVRDTEIQNAYGNSKAFFDGIAAAKAGKTGKMRYFYHSQERIAAYRPTQILPDHHWTVIVAAPISDASTQLSRVGVDAAFIWFTIVLSLAVGIIALMMMVNLLRSHELQAAKEEFVNLASHQLRTPATAVKAYLDLVFAGIGGEINQEQRKLLEVASESNQRQIRIVNDMLHVARFDAGRIKLKPTPTDLKLLLTSIIDEQQSTIDERQQTIRLLQKQKKVTALLDASYGRMVFENLISNASKYTPEGGKLTVTIDIKKDAKGNYATVSVKDTGVGIAKKDIPKLFRKLNRIGNELSSNVGGTGLGLYLAKAIVEKHKGKIEVESAVGKGSEFTVCLPRADKANGET